MYALTGVTLDIKSFDSGNAERKRIFYRLHALPITVCEFCLTKNW